MAGIVLQLERSPGQGLECLFFVGRKFLFPRIIFLLHTGLIMIESFALIPALMSSVEKKVSLRKRA
jgi:hypothetical protein